MASVFDALLDNPFLLIIVIIVIVALIYYYFLRGPPKDKFEMETFEDVTTKELEEKFKLKGIRNMSGLAQGFDYLGDINKWFREKGKHRPIIYDEKKNRFIFDEKEKGQDYDMYFFRISRSNRIAEKLGFGRYRYAIIDSKHILNIDQKEKLWNVSNTVQFVRLGNIFVSSHAGEEYLNDICVKRSNENQLTFLMNYAPKIIWLEMRHAKIMDQFRTIEETRKKNWSEYKEASGIDVQGEENA